MYCYICSKKFGIFCKVYNCCYCKHYFCVNCLSSNPPPVCFICFDKLTNAPVEDDENVQNEQQPTSTIKSNPTAVEATISSTKRTYCATTPSEFEYVDRTFSQRLKAIFLGINETSPPSHYQRQQEEKVNQLMQHYQRVRRLQCRTVARAPLLIQLPSFESTINALRDMRVDGDSSSDSSDSSNENDLSLQQLFKLIVSKYIAASLLNKKLTMLHLIQTSKGKEKVLITSANSAENSDIDVKKPIWQKSIEVDKDEHVEIVDEKDATDEEKKFLEKDETDDEVIE